MSAISMKEQRDLVARAFELGSIALRLYEAGLMPVAQSVDAAAQHTAIAAAQLADRLTIEADAREVTP